MNSGLTSERVYHTLKEQLLNGSYRPGDRLEPALLADALSSSATPVREALNVMTGEQLLESRPGGGFHVPAIDQPGLSDLYSWNGAVLSVAVKAWVPYAMLGREKASELDGDEPTRTLFAALARLSPNLEHAKAIAGLSDRLQAVRNVEASILGDPGPELAEIATAAERGERAGIQRLIAAFHRRRVRHSAGVVRALYRRV